MKKKNKIYHTVGTFPKPNRKFVERGKICIPKTQIHDRSLSWLGIGNSIKKNVRVKSGYIDPRLKSSLQQFYGRHHDMVDSYEISISEISRSPMTMDLVLFIGLDSIYMSNKCCSCF